LREVDGVIFSFVLNCVSLLFSAVVGARLDVSSVDGAETSAMNLGPGVDLNDLNDFREATLSVADFEFREHKLLLLERRPVSRKGKRSFITGDFGVSNPGREVEMRHLTNGDELSVYEGYAEPSWDFLHGLMLSHVRAVGFWLTVSSFKPSKRGLDPSEADIALESLSLFWLFGFG